MKRKKGTTLGKKARKNAHPNEDYIDIANNDGHTPRKMGPVRNDPGMRAASMGLVDSRPGTFIGYNQNDGAPTVLITEPTHNKPSSVTNASERHVARLFFRYDSIFPVGPSRHVMPATTKARWWRFNMGRHQMGSSNGQNVHRWSHQTVNDAYLRSHNGFLICGSEWVYSIYNLKNIHTQLQLVISVSPIFALWNLGVHRLSTHPLGNPGPMLHSSAPGGGHMI